ncbi:DUF4361 domain-containing protein [Sphingobacterium alkalisoli]|uniref:DUF4361 domain-containing protein n=1 Tax=Sphingobacterium alkalisoli TaxID=1874115 RepID=A0A4U0H9F2_9SPHI|nr:DUF4361 domain-containing protein [Sphingobacterium alkalisoli]TJY68517.1 DUF4361 domain-containing protein [Sphingobacterium alkalisoli]GGH05939.1 hypothetical protein GCM10011418_02400 [Sphingobacterium alkalisoli]
MKRRYIAILAFTTMFTSCDDHEMFEKEMYKNEVSLISSDDHNVFQEVVQMTGGEIIGYVAASVGGTHAPEKDLVIGLEEDPEPLKEYNWSNFDAAEDLYAKLVPAGKYELLDDKIIIKAGERTGRTMIKLRPEGLSPDSTYFIGLKATDVSGVEINPTKNTVLYQVSFENAYASQITSSRYTMTGIKDGEIPVAANKELFPLTHNSVRMIAGNETFQSTEAAFAKTAIILEVDEDNKVSIKPYKDIQVTQLNNDPLYPNMFRIEEAFGRKTNVFLLKYEYTISGVTNVIQERVEMQVR